MTAQPALVIIEDDPVQSALIAAILTHPDYAVGQILGVFAHGLLFFDWYARSSPPPSIDLILLDLRLPHMSGSQVLAAIRQLPGLAGVQVVAVTANIMPDDLRAAQQAGFDGLIGKPIQPLHFPAQIRAILAGQPVWRPL